MAINHSAAVVAPRNKRTFDVASLLAPDTPAMSVNDEDNKAKRFCADKSDVEDEIDVISHHSSSEELDEPQKIITDKLSDELIACRQKHLAAGSTLDLASFYSDYARARLAVAANLNQQDAIRLNRTPFLFNPAFYPTLHQNLMNRDDEQYSPEKPQLSAESLNDN
jgi:hypothetical protein